MTTADDAATLRDLLAPEALMELAGRRAYAFGAAYLDDGRVERVAASDSLVTALVRGSLPYHVRLEIEGGELRFSCTCPVGDEEEFCKHGVAVALTLSAPDGPPGVLTVGRHPKQAGSRPQPTVDLATYVGSLDHSELVELVLAQAEGDWQLRERLVARAAAASGSGIDQAMWRQRLEAVFSADSHYADYVPYHEARGWASDVVTVIDALGDLIDSGHGAAVVALAEHAYRLAEAAIQYIDDSDGWITEIAIQIGEVHQRACAEAGDIDRVELARRLTVLELESELDTFRRAALIYAEVLGANGLAAYRRLVEPRWRKELATTRDRWSSDRYRLGQAMVGIALAADDPDELIRVKAADLRTPDDHAEIARTLRAAGRDDEAIEWCRRGLDTFGDRIHQIEPLSDLLADLLRQRGDTAGAVAVFRTNYARHPSVATYRRLLAEAELDGADTSAAERQAALDLLRAQVSAGPTAGADRRRPDDTLAGALIRVLLHEGLVDEAWATATAHDCDERLWMTLARARESTHPLDCIPVYRRAALALIESRNNRGYEEAVKLLARIRTLADNADQPELFTDLLLQVRTTHKAKRNLMALLAQKRW